MAELLPRLIGIGLWGIMTGTWVAISLMAGWTKVLQWICPSIFLKFFTKAWTMRLTPQPAFGMMEIPDPTERVVKMDLIIGTFCRVISCWVHGKLMVLNSVEFSNCQVGEFLLLQGEIDETDRLLIEGYLAHKWGIALPSSHPWNAEGPTFGEIITDGVTPVGFTGSTSGPIAINLGTANLRQSTASLTGQLINPGRGILKPGDFSPNDYPGLELWLDTSAENGVDYDPALIPDPIPWNPFVVQEVVFHLDANDSSGITLSDQDVAEWRDKSGNGYDMVAQGHQN